MNSKLETRNTKQSLPSAREIAFHALQNWESKGWEIQRSLTLEFVPDLLEVDKALSYELAYGVIRRKLLLDEVIRQFSNISFRQVSKRVRNVLRLGLYQLLYMDRIPEHSAVDESVKIAKSFCGARSSGFVNALLREFLRKDRKIVLPEDPAQSLSISTSHPLELVQRWIYLWGINRTKILCEEGNIKPHWTLRVNSLKTTRPVLLKRLRDEGLDVVESQAHPLAILLKGTSPIVRSPSFLEGLFQVQDEFMLKVIDQLELYPGLQVLDLCSAPGTKATAIAEKIEDQGRVIAVDHSFSRMRLVLDNIKRLTLHSICPVIADAGSIQSILRSSFDRVLIDVPCSNTGVFAKRVEARWRYASSDLKRLADLQTGLLEEALKVLKPGGLLVYSTCSIDPSENEEVVRRVLKGKSNVCLVTEESFFPAKGQGGGYWAKLKK